MNYIHKRRITYVILFMIGLTTGASLIFYALKQNLNAFLTPSQIQAAHLSHDDEIRLGGLVKKNSLKQDAQTLTVHFVMTDYQQDINVQYTGVLPDLFREGKGAIVEGKINAQGIFVAHQVLAKHDENYMPPSVAAKIRNKKI